MQLGDNGQWPKSLSPYNHVGNLDRVPGPWLKHGPALAFVVIWGVNQYMEDLSVSLFVILP